MATLASPDPPSTTMISLVGGTAAARKLASKPWAAFKVGTIKVNTTLTIPPPNPLPHRKKIKEGR
jgi:hypothetical protein